ncbi:hypothetical protein FQA39_LY09261 [Lamprigera yunnana]|nr:hypothetical protein FQA39_LY09261 [Lamprigera yunnana]
MDFDCNESYPINSDIILQETFSFSGNYEDYGNGVLKTEPVDIEESFKYDEEDNVGELADVLAVSVQQYICNQCNFVTTEKNSLIQH